ncbi:biopolymer transporter [Candidatus Methylacidiphilum fumarolicum]|uniref:Biopolymer transport protein (Modular protein) n=2 Tax=Candidatus Methylacidiphilum fumarolicum TaxID=591154 RepID=I0K1A3_METFB|nr:MotA/TolQ/ExbB proton channel family protein [Candidatus Methylacidiphilum fumarolicum]TFE70341.1 biopolymer transporter [Candidatus Methylacidiphilum fumarolicum]TFE77853.1 biopolymer transporter [Candidatus Methylacidiphilum fumarolicum]CAI9086791.1 MotA/TolQ/ExbB proton channel family protein [Candidatus Methylacidiphilum fumarolicum]CCG93272.1 Biopolymer transport protein (modular protein) [Methylacidiphilum fumariolicum SolV]
MNAFFFQTSGLFFSFEKATIATKLILLFLLGVSSISWTVLLIKLWQIHSAKKQSRKFLRKLKVSSKWLGIFLSKEIYPGSPHHAIYMTGCKELFNLYHGLSDPMEGYSEKSLLKIKIPEKSLKLIQGAIEREIGNQLLQLEDQMILLATAASGAPFIGLLGTVWGVMDAFGDLALSGKATLATMAPGVSGSLLSTVMGLLVAIPALFGYNFIVATIKALTIDLENFATEVLSEIEKRFVAEDSI